MARDKDDRSRTTSDEDRTALLEALSEVWKDHLPTLYAHLLANWHISKDARADGILSAARHRLLKRQPPPRYESNRQLIRDLCIAIDSEATDRWRRTSAKLIASDMETLDTFPARAGTSRSRVCSSSPART